MSGPGQKWLQGFLQYYSLINIVLPRVWPLRSSTLVCSTIKSSHLKMSRTLRRASSQWAFPSQKVPMMERSLAPSPTFLFERPSLHNILSTTFDGAHVAKHVCHGLFEDPGSGCQPSGPYKLERIRIREERGRKGEVQRGHGTYGKRKDSEWRGHRRKREEKKERNQVEKKALSHAEAEEIKVANVDASAQVQSWEFCCCSSN